MNVKFFIVTALLFIAGISIASAQDKIHLKNGGVIDAKVKEVSSDVIKYKKKDNPDGPNYTVKRREVESITYANGTKDEMDEMDEDDNDDRNPRDRRERAAREPRSRRFGFSNEKYGKNIISLAPIQMANEGPAGIGLHYERVLDKRSMLSFYLPIAVIIHRNNDYYYNGTYNNNDRNTTFTYFYPGIKVYPTGSNRRVSYAAGISAALGFGSRYVQDVNFPSPSYSQHSVFRAGMLVNNSLNVQPTKHIYLGVELGLGFTYIDDMEGDDNNNYYNNYGDVPMVQFNFKIGYRF